MCLQADLYYIVILSNQYVPRCRFLSLDYHFHLCVLHA